jgi:hypothetical protein
MIVWNFVFLSKFRINEVTSEMVKSVGSLYKRVEHPLTRYLVWLVLLTVLLFSVFIRYKLLDVPLERDEGEYAYGGQLAR